MTRALLWIAVLTACTSDPVPAGPPPRSCGADGVAPSPFVHLTRGEVGWSLHDLFGTDPSLSQTLPIDDATTGFEVGAITSPLLVEQYVTLGETVATTVAPDDASAHALVGCADTSETCVLAYLERVGRRAFRRALTDDDRNELMGLYRTGVATDGFAGGVRLLVEGIITSADFLYHTEGSAVGTGGQRVRLDGNERAARLAFLFWRTVPDDALLDDAASGLLDTDQGLRMAADRMLADDRATRMIDDFYRQWLALDHIDTAISPDLTYDQIHGAHLDVAAYLRRVTRTGVFRDLLVPSAGDGIAPILPVDGEPPRGVLAAPGILLVLSRAHQTDPIHRGLFVRERFLCQHLPPPPPGVIFSVPDVSPDLTTRERFAAHTSQAACASCHTLMDPIGFGFEHYDELGRWRVTEGTLPIDATGEVVDGGDATGTFDGAQELAARLADSTTARDCFVRQWFRYAAQRIETPADQCSIDTMRRDFYAHEMSVADLMVSIAATEAFQNRRVPEDP